MTFDWTAASQALQAQGNCVAARRALTDKKVATSKPSGLLDGSATLVMEGREVTLKIREPRWMDFERGKDGVGPASLVEHVTGWPAEESVEWVVKNAKGCPVADALSEALALDQAMGPANAAKATSRM